MATFTARTFIKHDDYMTPKHAWEDIKQYIPKDKVIWEAFYGDGESGSWKIIDGNLKIIWNSGKSDYFFQGVMGYQRIRKNKNNSYTSGLKRLPN